MEPSHAARTSERHSALRRFSSTQLSHFSPYVSPKATDKHGPIRTGCDHSLTRTKLGVQKNTHQHVTGRLSLYQVRQLLERSKGTCPMVPRKSFLHQPTHIQNQPAWATRVHWKS